MFVLFYLLISFAITLSFHILSIPISFKVVDRTFNRHSSSFSVSLYSDVYMVKQFGEELYVLVHLKSISPNKEISLLL